LEIGGVTVTIVRTNSEILLFYVVLLLLGKMRYLQDSPQNTCTIKPEAS
jgi:hypothetical protein